MREKSDSSKMRDKRGVISPDRYEAWKTARESKSSGTAYAVYDPIQQRTVNLLSQGEMKVFWTLRFLPDVESIYDQVPLQKDIVDEICKNLGIRTYNAVLSTDFLVTTSAGKTVAISSKTDSKIYDPSHRHYTRYVNRLTVERAYWEDYHNIEFLTVFSDTINPIAVRNVRDVMTYWDNTWITDSAGKLMHMIAHHVIKIPLDVCRLRYRELSRKIPTCT